MNTRNKKHTIGMNAPRGIGTPALIAILAVIASVGGLVYYNAMYPVADKMMEQGDAMVKEGEEMMKDGEAMMEEGEAMMKEGESMVEKEGGEAMMEESSAMTEHGPYKGDILAGSTNGAVFLDFNKEDYEKIITSDKLVVLYFYANWCPVCKVEVASALYPTFNELTNKNVVGIRVNFNDNQTDSDEKNLAREFGIGYQHTKVFLKNGKRILKSPESWEKDRYITEINNILKN